MKFYRVLTFAVIAAISASFVSCSDDDDDKDDNGASEQMLPISVKVVSVTPSERATGPLPAIAEYKYTYNNDKYLTGYSFKDATDAYAVKISYDENNRIIKSERTGDDPETLTYRYKDDKIAAVKGEKDTVTVFKVDKNWRLLKAAAHKTKSEDVYSYDGKGNITKVVNELNKEEETFEYNDKNGMFKNTKTPQWFFAADLEQGPVMNLVNGCSKQISKDEDGTENISYTYPSYVRNMPIAMTMASKKATVNAVISYNNVK